MLSDFVLGRVTPSPTGCLVFSQMSDQRAPGGVASSTHAAVWGSMSSAGYSFHSPAR